ncbi:unnamed protein product [Rhodiola kirilowii]
MDFSIRKSFKLPQQHSLSRKNDDMSEKLPILVAHEEELAMRSGNTSERKEMIVQIDGDEDGGVGVGGERRREGEAGQIWRESSYEFWKDDEERVNAAMNGGGFRFPEPVSESSEVADDPPSKLIGQFLHRQQASGEISLDMDLEMDELQPGRRGWRRWRRWWIRRS